VLSGLYIYYLVELPKKGSALKTLSFEPQLSLGNSSFPPFNVSNILYFRSTHIKGRLGSYLANQRECIFNRISCSRDNSLSTIFLARSAIDELQIIQFMEKIRRLANLSKVKRNTAAIVRSLFGKVELGFAV
jgi:hypothetical protein